MKKMRRNRVFGVVIDKYRRGLKAGYNLALVQLRLPLHYF